MLMRGFGKMTVTSCKFLVFHVYLFKQVSYFNQVTSGVLPYFAANLTGSSKSIEDTASECIRFLESESSKINSTLF